MRESGSEIATQLELERVGPCRLLRRVGAGQAGSVYVAELQKATTYGGVGDRVAVKLLRQRPQGPSDELVERFRREAEIGAAVEHPAVVRVFEADAQVLASGDSILFLVLELVDGRDLAAYLRSLGRVPEPLLRLMAEQIASGLAAIHERGAVHRDVKPANVIVTRDNQVKLTDLGVARFSAPGRTVTSEGGFVGTPTYAAPEQFADGRVGVGADLYALGVVLYEAATGVQPFAGSSLLAVMRRHQEHVPPRASTINGDLSEFFDEVLVTLLEKIAARRFRSAAELVAVLQQGEASRWWSERIARANRKRRWSLRGGHRIRFVGRERELAVLTSLLREAEVGGARIAVVSGEAGIGKTRLLAELTRRIESSGQDVLVLHGAHASGDRNDAYGAVAQALLAHFGHADLAEKLRPYLSSTPGLVDAFVSLLRGDAPDESVLTAQATHALIGQLARQLADEQPVVWLVEDLHNASVASVELLIGLTNAVHDRRTLIVLSTRPTLDDGVARSIDRLREVERVNLVEMDDRAITALAEAQTGSAELATRIGPALAARADGNPYFALELLHWLTRPRGGTATAVGGSADDGVGISKLSAQLASMTTPPSLRELLGERLALLTSSEQALLEVAAVQGSTFRADLSAQALDRDPLEVTRCYSALERDAGLVRGDGARFVFDHHLRREVIYETMDVARRRFLHTRLADCLEQYPSAERSERGTTVTIVSHRLRGNDPRAALSLVPDALEFLAGRGHHEAVLDLSEMALSHLTPVDGVLRADLLRHRGLALGELGRREEQLEVFELALAAAREVGDLSLSARILQAISNSHTLLGNRERAEVSIREAVRTAVEAGDDALVALMKSRLAWVWTLNSQYDEAVELLEQALPLAIAAGDSEIEGWVVSTLAHAHTELSHHERAESYVKRSLELSKQLGDRRSEALDYINLGAIARSRGDMLEARQLYEQGAQLCRGHGDLRGEAGATVNLGELFMDLGRLREAREYLLRGIDLGCRSAVLEMELHGRIYLIELAIDEASMEQAELYVDACEARVRTLGEQRVGAKLTVLRGRIARATCDLEEASRLFAAGIEAMRGASSLEPLGTALLELGRVLFEQGEWERAARVLSEACPVLEETRQMGPLLLAGCYRQLMRDRTASVAAIGDGLRVQEEAEANMLFHRLGRGAHHLEQSKLLLEQLSSHLAGDARQQFWAHNPIARAVSELGGGPSPVLS